ncbi:hypothetical protein DFH06DRAFT_1143805 [Mycena polygramma]|nr:hypothetical protein DFH06DRAFT_1143805 [Mycena polygramma]
MSKWGKNAAKRGRFRLDRSIELPKLRRGEGRGELIGCSVWGGNFWSAFPLTSARLERCQAEQQSPRDEVVDRKRVLSEGVNRFICAARINGRGLRFPRQGQCRRKDKERRDLVKEDVRKRKGKHQNLKRRMQGWLISHGEKNMVVKNKPRRVRHRHSSPDHDCGHRHALALYADEGILETRDKPPSRESKVASRNEVKVHPLSCNISVEIGIQILGSGVPLLGIDLDGVKEQERQRSGEEQQRTKTCMKDTRLTGVAFEDSIKYFSGAVNEPWEFQRGRKYKTVERDQLYSGAGLDDGRATKPLMREEECGAQAVNTGEINV